MIGRRLITARAGTDLLYAELVHPVLMVQLGSGPDAGLRRTTLVGGKPPTRGPAKANNKRYVDFIDLFGSMLEQEAQPELDQPWLVHAGADDAELRIT